MKEYNPKSDLWSKIERRKDFESQLIDLTKNLPSKGPNEDLWSKIEYELEQKPKVFPIWRFTSIAASIILILAFGGIFYLQSTSEKPTQDLISENSIPNKNNQNNIELDNGISIDAPKVEEETIEQKVSSIPREIQKPKNRVVANPITISKPSIISLNQDLKMVSDVSIVPSQPSMKSKTLHKVTISWGLNEKTKLRTQFGSTLSDPAFNQQLGRASKNSIKIKLNKE